MLVLTAAVKIFKTEGPTGIEALEVLSIGLVTVRVSEAPMFKFSDVASVLVIPNVTFSFAIFNLF